MTALQWDQVGERLYETGVDHGVLYPVDSSGEYDTGVAWNGLVTVTESPEGAEATPQYADNIQYLNLVSAEKFGATIEAFTYPDEFAACDGSVEVTSGVSVGQQTRKLFGLCYRTLVGNDVEGQDHGFKIHLVYGALAAPSEKAYGTVNESPEAITFSWEVSSTPVAVTGHKPSATLTIDSTKVDSGDLDALLLVLYGDEATDPRLPLPDEVIGMFEGTLTSVSTSGANSPTYNSGTHVVTLPSVTGIQWKINGVNKTAGAQTAMTVGQVSLVTAHPTTGYTIEAGDDNDWVFDY